MAAGWKGYLSSRCSRLKDAPSDAGCQRLTQNYRREWGAIGQARLQNRSLRDSASLRHGRLRQLLSRSITAFFRRSGSQRWRVGDVLRSGPEIPTRRLGRSPREPDGADCSIGVNVKQIFNKRNLPKTDTALDAESLFVGVHGRLESIVMITTAFLGTTVAPAWRVARWCI